MSNTRSWKPEGKKWSFVVFKLQKIVNEKNAFTPKIQRPLFRLWCLERHKFILEHGKSSKLFKYFSVLLYLQFNTCETRFRPISTENNKFGQYLSKSLKLLSSKNVFLLIWIPLYSQNFNALSVYCLFCSNARSSPLLRKVSPPQQQLLHSKTAAFTDISEKRSLVNKISVFFYLSLACELLRESTRKNIESSLDSTQALDSNRVDSK